MDRMKNYRNIWVELSLRAQLPQSVDRPSPVSETDRKVTVGRNDDDQLDGLRAVVVWRSSVARRRTPVAVSLSGRRW